MPERRLTYPFSAIVGQEKLKLALILNAVNPGIGGLLISGAKGTGKSLAVRAFEEILPEVDSVEGCSFNCNPHNLVEMCPTCRERLQTDGYLPAKKREIRIVQLPISTTEDRLIGTLDVETALKEGRKTLQPGLLAEANQNILYIDEVNLLPDHLINCFLDPAASGWNIIQREGFSLSHPARFTLIASMNPEEGELRPQILDRFALHMKIEPIRDLKQRMEIAWRNTSFEEDPAGFCEAFEKAQEELKNRIRAAQELLPKVAVSDQVFEGIAKVCSDLEVDGCRSDIAAVKAARALAAFKGKTVVEPEDILEVSDLALSHRRRKRGYEEPADAHTIISRLRESLSKVELPEPGEDMGRAQTEEEVLKFLGPQPTPPTTRRRRLRENRVFNAIFPLILFMLAFMMYFAAMSIVSFFLHIFAGIPLEVLGEGLSLSRSWPYIALMALATLILPLLINYIPIGRKRRVAPTYLYKGYGGKIGRRIVRQIRPMPAPTVNPLGFKVERSEPPPLPSRTLNIPLYASFSRLYRMILNRGPKIAESLKQLREAGKKYELSLTQRIGQRGGGFVGKRVKNTTLSHYGRYVCYRFPEKKPWDIALAPTVRAAAPFQAQRKRENLLIAIEPQDIRVKMREARTPLTIMLLLDMSESMATSMANIRNAVLSMHDIAYKKRDRVSLIVFKGTGASVLQPPTTNLNLLERKLLDVGTSDFTPLAAGMFQAWKVLRNEKLRNKEIVPTLIIVSDGIANVPLEKPLTPFTRSKFLNPAQADVIDAAALLQREGIRTIVINTAHEAGSAEAISKHMAPIVEKTNKRWMDPTTLLLEIPRITGGYYYGIGEGGEVESTVLMDAFTVIDREPHHPSG